MNQEHNLFMKLLGKLPPRLNARQTAWVINCQTHDLPALIHAKLIKPLGNPSANSIKYFATAEILERSQNLKWLNRATTVIYKHWRKKNISSQESLPEHLLNADKPSST